MIEELLKWQGFLIALLSVALGAGAAVFRARVLDLVADRAPAMEVRAVQQRMGVAEAHLHAVETTLRHMPTAGQMHELHVGLTDLRGDIKVVSAKLSDLETMMAGQGRKVELIDEHLRRAGT